MPNKKNSEPEQTPEEKALAERVDAMLDPNRPDQSPALQSQSSSAPAASDHPLDIFEGKSAPIPISTKDASDTPAEPTKTAPELPGKASKQASVESPKSEAEPASEPAEPQPEEPAPPAPDIEDTNAQLDDSETDKAVDEIAANEADALLAAEDAAKAGRVVTKKAAPRRSWKSKLVALLKNKWTWIGLALILVIILALPMTRYKLLGLVIKEPVTVRVLDSKTNTPVSNADVTLGGASSKTNAEGTATLRAALGTSQLQVTKQYYKTYALKYSVSFKAASTSVNLVATGRQVPITVLNKITGKPLQGAEIKVLATTAKTDSQGKATIVLPTTAASDNAVISLNGYNIA
ncbi:MAG TPA: hypothetical protein VN778_04740, partial [Verrucomicrobiae bacterium]|nr:hypothetical protein [Verrucomicrobiae bacterium]